MLIHTDRVGFLCNKLKNRRSRSFDISSVTLPQTILGEVVVTSSISRASHSLEVRTLDKLIDTLINPSTRLKESILHWTEGTLYLNNS